MHAGGLVLRRVVCPVCRSGRSPRQVTRQALSCRVHHGTTTTDLVPTAQTPDFCFLLPLFSLSALLGEHLADEGGGHHSLFSLQRPVHGRIQ
jgi:hypothetical protein